MSEDPRPKKKKSSRPTRGPAKKLEEARSLKPEGIGPIQHRLIGQFIVEWSKLEAAIEDLIWSILKISDEDGRIVTKRWDAVTKITILRALANRHLVGSQLDELVDALDDANLIRDDRNFIVHGLWGKIQPGNEPAALSLRPNANPGEIIAQTYPHDRMRFLIDEIGRVKEIVIQTLLSLQPSPDKSTSQDPPA